MNYDPVYDSASSLEASKLSPTKHAVSISSLLTNDTQQIPEFPSVQQTESTGKDEVDTDEELLTDDENTAHKNYQSDGKHDNQVSSEYSEQPLSNNGSEETSVKEPLSEEDSLPNGKTANSNSKKHTNNNAISDASNLPSSQKKSLTLLLKSRSRHLKKHDGEPMWRKDIQYEFLKELFNNDAKVFTNPFKQPGPIPNPSDEAKIPNLNDNKLTFSDLYMRTFAESSKCSKVLRERLLTDKIMAKSVGMVCLLVNVGRMNTTVNFVPEMRSQLRTYHSIPVLQVNTNSNTKTLQDTPRLKSILKAVCEDDGEPRDFKELFKLKTTQYKNPNIINLIFLMSSYENDIKYLCPPNGGTQKKILEEKSRREQFGDFDPLNQNDDADSHGDFFDFFLNSKMDPKSRARRFLWLMYTYLETDFSEAQLCKNPFGDGVNSLIPPVELVPAGVEFDVDTDEEKKYGYDMIELRKGYLVDEEHNSTPKRGRHPLPKKNEADEKDSIPSQPAKRAKKGSSKLSEVVTNVGFEKNTKQINKLINEISARKDARFQYRKMRKGLLKMEYEKMKLQLEDRNGALKYNKVNELNKYKFELIKKSNDRFFRWNGVELYPVTLAVKDGEIRIEM